MDGVCVHTPIDADGDGHPPIACGGGDCDDANPNVNPDAEEICGNGVDDDSDGLVACEDPDCFGCGGCSPQDWATVLEFEPDPTVLTDPEARAAIIATGLPWRVRDNRTQIEMLLVPAGTFVMGCSPSLQSGCAGDENPIHQVILTRPFYLGRYEVTQAEWTALMGTNPSSFQGQADSPQRPVENISWNRMTQFKAASGLRLPTEAEWEYACRAGTQTAYHNSSSDAALLNEVAWFSGNNSPGGTKAVGQKLANAWGFHDMHGNVYEWCEDWYSETYYATSPTVDPTGPASGTQKVMRSGFFNAPAAFCRASTRTKLLAGGGASFYNGFRAARTPSFGRETCGDGVDDDGDGLIDCDDPDCFAELGCCPDGQAACGGACVDLATDLANCGECGVVCDDGDPCTVDACVDGVCVHTPIDADGDGYPSIACGGGDCDDGDPNV
ncbi:MAG: SUMF1/EgtB/PvdO family nonheme iron enzyme, partial [Phycisphaerales bacterium]